MSLQSANVSVASSYRLHASGRNANGMKDFKKLLIWQVGMEIVDKVYEVVSVLPAEEKYGMRSQMTRSAVSIPSNIAEGSAKTSQKDYARFLEISLGSVFELETHSLVVQRRQWVDETQMNELLELIKREQQMLQSFLKKF